MIYFLFTASRDSRFKSSILNAIVCAGIVLFANLGLSNAHAEMVIESTRVIYPEAQRDVSFRITNASKDKPAFVQLWLDDGNSAAAPEDVITPFNLTPPVARLKAEASQVVRLIYSGDPLPADRESVFWFNMLEVPPKSKEENRLSFAIRTRIKVFFRPKALKGDPIQSMDKVNWKIVKKEDQLFLEGQNPSPFHMSFFSFSLGTGSQFEPFIDGGMVPPMGTATFLIPPDRKTPTTLNKVKVEFINDYGGAVTKEFAVTFAP